MSSKSLKILFAVLLNWLVSILMVFLNKHLLNSKELKFDAPLFVTWYQCICGIFIYSLWFIAIKIFSNGIKFEISLKTAIKVIPLSTVFVAMITFNNLSLKHVPISFYMIAKSLATFFNLVLVYVYFGEKTSIRAISCCVIITIGFCLGINQEKISNNGFNNLGVIYGILSAFFSALTGVYIKKTIKILNEDLWKLNFYINLFASIVILPIIYFLKEQEKIIQFEGLSRLYFWFLMSLTGFLGFFVGYANSLQIQLTSPLTHNISGTTKSCLQTLLGVVYFIETKTILWWISNFLILCGAFFYSLVRNKEMNKDIV